MTTLFNFQPNSGGPFQFQPTLDGSLYNVSVPWGLFRKDWYVQCLDLSNNPIFYRALIASPTGIAIQALSWAANIATVTCVSPHGFRVGQTFKITISGCVPTAFNGTVIALAISPTQFTYLLSGNPDMATQVGGISQDLNIAGGYFNSTLVFRESTRTFEVNP